MMNNNLEENMTRNPRKEMFSLAEYNLLEQKLAECERSKKSMISNLPGVVYRCLYDMEWTMIFISEGVYDLTGYKAEDFIGNKSISFNDIIMPEFQAVLRDAWEKEGSAMNPIHLEYKIMTADHKEKWVLEKGLFIFDEKGNLEAVEGLIIDITDGKEKQDKIAYLSFYDQLTGVYNRRFYEEELRRLNNGRSMPITLVLFDVNGLKLINDAFGHFAGDKVLKKAAEVIKKQCREGDIIARIGGDEFVVLLPNTSASHTEIIVKRIQNAMKKERVDSVMLSVSCGWETKTQPEQDIALVFKKAEDLMYTVKLRESFSMRQDTIQAIIKNLYNKTNMEEAHANRVSQLCEKLGQAMEFNGDYISQLKTAGLMHDIGKIAVNEKILNKTDKLNENEWLEIKRHPEIGYNILRSISEYGVLAEQVLGHQERWDGTGYPRELKGDQIPLISRIISIADAFDAMTSFRPYRNTMSEGEALAEIKRCEGTQFDPEIGELFRKGFDDGESV